LIAIAILFAGILTVCGSLGGGKTTTTVGVTWDEGMTAGATRITNDGTAKDTVKASPDGVKLLYAEAAKKDTDGNWVWNIVYLRDANSPAKTPLITDFAFAPSWYADNTRFLYISYEGGSGRIVRSSVQGGGKTYITRAAVGDTDNSPSIRNGLIICNTWVNGKWQLVTLKENGTEPTFLGEGRWPSWHPTENKIVFIRNGDIYEMDMANNQVTQIYSDPKYACSFPSYSPNGKKILFDKGAAVKVDGVVKEETSGFNIFGLKLFSNTKRKSVVAEVGRRHIFVINSDGSNASPLSSGTADVRSPCWGANDEIFCVVDTGDTQEIYKLRLRTN
jgi:Tol biopolymer transport system component